MFCDIIIYTLGQKGGENMAREMTEQEEFAASFAARKLNPSFQPDIRVEIEEAEAEPHEFGCGKCGGKCGKCRK